MINALPPAQANAASMPPPRSAAGGDDRAAAANFARLLDQASIDGRGAAGDSPAPHSAKPSASAPAAPAPAEAAATEPAEHAAEPLRKGTTAPAGEHKAGPRVANRGGAQGEGAEPAALVQPVGLDASRPPEDGDAGSLRSAEPKPDDASLAQAIPTPAALPQTPAALPFAAATALRASGANAAGAASGMRAGAAAHAAGADGVAFSMQAAQADAATPAAASSRFGDALAAATVVLTGAPEGRADSQLAQAQPPTLLAPPAGIAPAVTPASAAAAAEATLAAPPGSAAFASQLGAQVTTFVRNGIDHAQLHLNPAEMGPVTVQIRLDGDSARVHMAAEHGITRQALEQAMPQLAASLREAGLTLSGGGVFEQPRQGNPDADGGQRRGGKAGRQEDMGTIGDIALTGPGTGTPRRRGVVDLVA